MGVVGDIYEGGGAKPVNWERIGQTVEGVILAVRSKQLTKFGTEIPETWDDGSAKMTPIVTVQLESGFDEDEDDDGKRDVYLRSNAYTAFGNALREAFKSKPDDSDLIGCVLKLQFYNTEKSGKGQPRKLFRARITRKSAAAGAWDEAPAATPAASPAPKRLDDDIPF